MGDFDALMHYWEQALNSDEELRERNKNVHSSLEGKTALQIEVESFPPFVVNVKNGCFNIVQGIAEKPLLRWRVPIDVFQDVLLGKHRLIFSLLDPKGELSFDTRHFTHWDGATIVESLLLAHEMVANNPELQALVKRLEG